MNRFFVATVLVLGLVSIEAQELNCRVQVVAPQVSNVERRVLDGLRDAVRDFMNDRKWTNDKFDLDERIECNLLLTLNEVSNNTRFSGKLQVQSNRIVFNSNYDSPMLNLVDEDVSFEYLENTILEFQLDQHRSNLASILAYYAYIIVGMDYDSFALEGGTPHFSNAQQVVVNAQNSSDAGWKAFENNKNRYWLVENALHQAFKPLRSANYNFHRNGLDKMYENANLGRAKITQSISSLRKVHQSRPLSYNMRLFFLAKADEILNIYADAPVPEKNSVYNDLQIMDPANISKYNRLKGNN
ncbi:MAG: DUF4835 family protein [Flavobacteriales bacterium]|nr:DUF4835 family protein [Flavobacteriales bacterium]NNK81185.1 DUF4835 family protein [Flavobacteriales bacterium]